MEKALEDIGINPTVISTTDSIKGAIPLIHSECCILKIHGDYLDTRIRNTPFELASYDEELNVLLDRVFDEFGIITCGWSGNWDFALGDAIKRCANHRYTTYWATLGVLGDKAKELIDFRKGVIIKI